MHYVARFRMQVARTWLEDHDLGVGETAVRLGYPSDAAFIRAFKRFISVSPGSVRRRKDYLPVKSVVSSTNESGFPKGSAM